MLMSSSQAVYKRILLKLSGEALLGSREFGIDRAVVADLADQIREVRELGVEIALVVGGGNIFRGLGDGAAGMERVTADHMGMLATVMNALSFQDALEQIDVPTRLLTGIEMRTIGEPYIRRRAVRHLERGRVVLFGGGTGNPFFTTDTAAALRASEVSADAVLKATNIDGVYTADPRKDSSAQKLPELTYQLAVEKQLGVMDGTSFTLCRDNKIPIVVFDLHQRGNIKRVVLGEPIGSIVRDG